MKHSQGQKVKGQKSQGHATYSSKTSNISRNRHSIV